MTGDFLTTSETATTLGVSTRHVRRLADSRAITRVAHGLIDQRSVDNYLASKHQGRTRAWAEHTAWGAVALLSGIEVTWLGAAQVSRLRSTLLGVTDPDDLLTRMRNRTKVYTYEAHRAAVPRLHTELVSPNLGLLGLTNPVGDYMDGYLSVEDLDTVVHELGLRSAIGGHVTVRTTGFDFATVRTLVATPVVAALDAATSTDPRVSGVGRRVLSELLEAYQ